MACEIQVVYHVLTNTGRMVIPQSSVPLERDHHRSRATAFHIDSPRLYYDLSYTDGWDSSVDVILGHTAHVEGCVPLFQ